MSYVIIGKSTVGDMGGSLRRPNATAAVVEMDRLNARGFDVTVRNAATQELVTADALRKLAADGK